MDTQVAGRLMALEAVVLCLAQRIPSDEERMEARGLVTAYIEGSYREGFSDLDHEARQIALQWAEALLAPRHPRSPRHDATKP